MKLIQFTFDASQFLTLSLTLSHYQVSPYYFLFDTTTSPSMTPIHPTDNRQNNNAIAASPSDANQTFNQSKKRKADADARAVEVVTTSGGAPVNGKGAEAIAAKGEKNRPKKQIKAAAKGASEDATVVEDPKETASESHSVSSNGVFQGTAIKSNTDGPSIDDDDDDHPTESDPTGSGALAYEERRRKLTSLYKPPTQEEMSGKRFHQIFSILFHVNVFHFHLLLPSPLLPNSPRNSPQCCHHSFLFVLLRSPPPRL